MLTQEQKKWMEYLNQFIKESGRESRGFLKKQYNKWVVEIKESYNKKTYEKSKLDKLHDFLLYDVLLLWPVWFLLIYFIGNIIIHGF